MIGFARFLIPGYCDPGLVYEDKLKQNLTGAGSWVDAGCGANFDIYGEPSFPGLAVGCDLPFRKLEKYLCGDLRALPFKDASVEFISSRWVLEHLEKPEEALSELERVLKPRGRLLMRTTNRCHLIALLSRVLPMGLKRRLTRADVFPTFYRLNDRWAFRRALKKHPGLKVSKLTWIENLHYGSTLGFICSVLSEFLLRITGLSWLKFSIILEIVKD